MRRTLLILLLVTFTGVVFPQSARLRFSAITTQQGLSNNWVRCIYQDNNGFIWAGTADGLNRFDGFGCKVFRPVDEKGRSLGDIHINAFLTKDQHSAWVCTDNGVYVFDFNRQEKLVSFILGRSSVLCAQEDAYGGIWFGTSRGLYRYNLTDSVLIPVNFPGADRETGNSNFVNTIYLDRDSSLWAGTKNGLFFCSKKNHYKKEFQRLPATTMLKEKDVMSLCRDNFGRLWIATFQDGLFVLAKDREQKEVCIRYIDGHFTSLMSDAENNLWVGRSSDEGLARVELDETTHLHKPDMVTYLHNPADPYSLNDNSVVCLFRDKHNDTWIGTNEGGMNFFSKREKQFYAVSENDPVRSTIQCNLVNTFFEEEQYLWIGTEEGLERWDKNTGEFVHFDHRRDNPGSLGANPVFSILKDQHGNLWVGTWAGGLNLYNYRTNTFTRMVKSADPHSISSNNVISLLEDRYGYLWVTTQGGGLNLYDHRKRQFRRFEHNENDPGSLYHTSVNDIIETSAGDILVSTYFSIDVFDRETETFRHFVYSDDEGTGGKIVSLFEDSRSNIWLTTNRGLEIFDLATGTFTLYFTDSTQTNNVAQGMLEDRHGHLWVSTNNGLYKIVKGIQKPARPEFLRFTKEDGLSGNEFTKRAAFLSNTGNMYFGSSQGFTYFHPDSILLNTLAPAVVLNDMLVLQEQPGKKVRFQPISGNVNNLKVLELSHKHADFIITFAALNYLHPEKNQYQYKLEGYDKSWIDAGAGRFASYTNIQPGHYTFMVKGSNNDGIWSAEAREIAIVIHPPWWRTHFFKIVMGLIALALVFSIYYIRVSFLKRQNYYLEQKVMVRTKKISEMNKALQESQEEIVAQNNELEKHRNHLEQLVDERTTELVKAKIKAEESDRLKSSFLANMSHEIRTPMNAIYGFASLLKDGSPDEAERNEYIHIMNTNCESLLKLIDDLMDISMLEINNLKITPDFFNVFEVLCDLEEQFKLKSPEPVRLAFVNRSKNENLVLHNDKYRFIQVFSNLISNALKFTEKGSVLFGYQRFEDRVRFYVSDTGSGIDKAQHEKIFSQFYKIEDNTGRQHRGTGIGLAICRELIRLMGGKIWVESEPEKGSTFYFTLPDNNEIVPMAAQESEIVRNALWLKGLTILIAEDDPTNYRLLVAMLKSSGANIYWAQDGQEAITFIKNKPQDERCLVLMDIKMPVMDGFEANRQIKLIDRNIPVIAVTAYAQIPDREKIMSSGFNGYISKPFKLDTLINELSKHVAQPE